MAWALVLIVNDVLAHQLNRNVDLREYLTEEAQVSEKNTTYDLVANVVHDGKPNEGAYRIHVLHHVSCCRHGRNLAKALESCMASCLTCEYFWWFPVHWLVTSFMSNQGTGKWYEMQDLQVIDILPQMITLSEAYIQASPLTYSVDVAHLCFGLSFKISSANQKWNFRVVQRAGGHIVPPQLSKRGVCKVKMCLLNRVCLWTCHKLHFMSHSVDMCFIYFRSGKGKKARTQTTTRECKWVQTFLGVWGPEWCCHF